LVFCYSRRVDQSEAIKRLINPAKRDHSALMPIDLDHNTIMHDIKRSQGDREKDHEKDRIKSI
jgi:adenylate kinase family enzyme